MKNILKFHTILLTLGFCFGALIRPGEDAYINYTHIPFEWDQEPDAIGYNLQVSAQFSFNSLLIDINVQRTIHVDINNVDWSYTYYWRVRPIYDGESGDYEFGDWIGSSSFSIGDKQFPERNADIYNESLIQDGLVAFGGFAPDFSSAVIDKYGNEVWNTGEEGSFDFLINHINEYGTIFGMSLYDHPNNTGTKINYDRDFLWSAPTADPAYAVDIHEIKQISNGNYMAFVPDYQLGPIPLGNWTFIYQSMGYVADGVTDEYPWIGMRIIEWDENGNEIWSWDPFEHFTMDDTDLYGGTWWNFSAGAHDWMHSNAFHFDEVESVIYVSHRHLSRISKISYPSGDVIWNIGMPEEYNTGSDNICTDLGSSFQHNIQLLDDETLLFFDNGNLSPMLMGDSNPTSRIRRIRVIDNSSCEMVWEYDLPQNLFGLGMGSVQLLDNGNYLLYTFGSGLSQSEPTLREVTSEHEVVWNYQGASNAAWYRTYKIPSIHPDVFSVIASDYKSTEDGNGIAVSSLSPSMIFTIQNESGYSQDYYYLLTDDGNGWFDNSNGVVSIAPNSSEDISFESSFAFGDQTEVSLMVSPIHHPYRQRNLSFSVFNQPGGVLGDINYDDTINILDVVLMVSMILGAEDPDYNTADINSDGEVNVIDVVLLVNLILDT